MRRLLTRGVLLAVIVASTACTLRPVFVREAGSADAVDARADAIGTDSVADATDVTLADITQADAPSDVPVDLPSDARICADGSCAPVNDERSTAIVIFAMGPEDAGAGTDAGFDAGRDAGSDAGPDGGEGGIADAATDASPTDVGVDIPVVDSGPADAGAPIPLTFTVRATTVGANHSVDAPCDPLRGGADVFYRFVLTDREIVYADTFTATFGTILFFARADGTPVADNPRACDVNFACGADARGSQAVAVLAPGTYYLVLSGLAGETGSVDIHVKRLPVGEAAVETLPAGMSNHTGRVIPAFSATNFCPASSGGGSNTYYWTTCPSAMGGTFTATVCPDSFPFLIASLYFSNADFGPVCTYSAVCGGFNLGGTLSTAVAPGARLNALYVAGRSGGQNGFYQLAVSNRP